MPLLTLELNLNQKYVDMIKEFWKYLILLLTIHILMSQSGLTLNLGGSIFNDEFMGLLLIILLSYLMLTLVVDEIVQID